MHKRARTLVLLSLSILLLSPAWTQNSQSGDVWERAVANQLYRVSGRLRNDGYARATTTYTGAIEQGQQQYADVYLKADVNYAFVAVCDQDCMDVDLVLLDQAGNVIDQDLGRDDTPIVSVTPKWDGTFRVWTKMVSCRRGPCRWGMGIFIRN
jgi:hypothetical protein